MADDGAVSDGCDIDEGDTEIGSDTGSSSSSLSSECDFDERHAVAELAYPVVSVDRWGTTDDLATSSLHSSRLSAFLMAAPHGGTVGAKLVCGRRLGEAAKSTTTVGPHLDACRYD